MGRDEFGLERSGEAAVSGSVGSSKADGRRVERNSQMNRDGRSKALFSNLEKGCVHVGIE